MVEPNKPVEVIQSDRDAAAPVHLGQELFLVELDHHPSRVPQTRTAKVVKLGRKWATLESGNPYPLLVRVERDNLEVECRDWRAGWKCYWSEQHWREDEERDNAWATLRRALRYKYDRPRHLSAQDILDFVVKLEGQTNNSGSTNG